MSGLDPDGDLGLEPIAFPGGCFSKDRWPDDKADSLRAINLRGGVSLWGWPRSSETSRKSLELGRFMPSVIRTDFFVDSTEMVL